MSPQKMETEKSGGLRTKDLLAASGYLAVLMLAGVFVIAWLRGSYAPFRAEKARRAGLAPQIKEAKGLGITYGLAMAEPAKAVGKPALWCLKKVGPDRTFYDGEEGKPVYIANPHRMGPPRGYRQDCEETLVTIRDVTAHEFADGHRAVRLTVDFVDYP